MVKVRHVTLFKKGRDDWMVSHVEVDCPNGEIARFEYEDKSIPAEGLKISRNFSFVEKWSKLETSEESEIVAKMFEKDS